ncbi:hypothetical protein K501DRAFT_322699 [Backusella circina FSU 941]|nr:hypothetical protein K501DRAFT_322699 [Backusella circina FSU 941]
MTRRKSVQELVKPLRKLSLLTAYHSHSELDLIQEQQQQHIIPIIQTDLISRCPKEVVFKIFSLLSFQDLVRVQLTCKHWCGLATDPNIWKSRYYQLNAQFPDIYAHKQQQQQQQEDLDWQTRYCRAITCANWRMGRVQHLHQLSNSTSRILSLKLKGNILVTLSEDNNVKLYRYMNSKFQYITKWFFGDTQNNNNIIECLDVLPDLNILVVAQRGSKCMFYDMNKGSKSDPIQVLKCGSHPWFVPDTISVNQDFFAVSGRKPSAVFVWNWRKGIRLLNRAFDNQPHNVFLSGNRLITVSVDGLMHISDILDGSRDTVTHYTTVCSLPCITYDDALSIVLAPHASRRIHHYKWMPSQPPQPPPSSPPSSSLGSPLSASPTEEQQQQHHHQQSSSKLLQQPSSNIPPPKRRLSTTFINLLGLNKSTTSLDQPPRPSKSSSSTLRKKHSRELYRSVRLRRHSSYNDYGYACQMRTDQYLKKHSKSPPITLPDFSQRPQLVHSIRSTPLGSAAKQVINIVIHDQRIATLNRNGEIALYALNGTTAACVTPPSNKTWIELEDYFRDDDDLSDGYDFMRTRLAIGSMGVIYGARDGNVWWLDFGCKID